LKTRGRFLFQVFSLGLFLAGFMFLAGNGCKTVGSSARPMSAAQGTCPEGFRPFTLTNSASQPVWIGLTAGAAPPPFTCTTDDDCGPNQVCDNPVCTSAADCNSGNLCDTNTGQCMMAPKTGCNGTAPVTTVTLANWECTGAKQVAPCTGCGDAGCDSATGLCLCSPGDAGSCPSGTLCSNTVQECSRANGGMCFFQQVAPGENQACNQNTSCPEGQSCNLGMGLCQYAADAGIPAGALELEVSETSTICMPSTVSATSVYSGRQAQLTSCTRNSDCQSNRCLVAVDGAITSSPTTCPTDGGASCLCRPVIGWSGGIFGRTGCQDGGTQCLSADCFSQPNQQCPIGKGGTNPFTTAEFTLQPNASDFYDVTIINGANLAMQMGPLAGDFAPPSIPSPYSCGTAGATFAQGPGDAGLEACSWSFSPDTSSGLDADYTALLRAVVLPSCQNGSCGGQDGGSGQDGGGLTCISQLCQPALTPCSLTSPLCPGNAVCSNPNNPSLGFCSTCLSDSDCQGNPAGSTCGTAFRPGIGSTTALIQTCGQAIGWWSYEDLCAAQPGFSYGPLNCNQTMTQGGVSDNLSNLFQCANNFNTSCYNSSTGTATSCCGCATSPANPLRQYWPTTLQAGINSQFADAGECVNNNPTWAANVQPWLAFLKQGCPTAYTYAFDDVSSTFTCASASTPDGGLNAVGYQVTFSDLK